MATWRDAAKAVIQQALEEAKSQCLSPEEMKKYVSSKYPFGARAYHPYKIWLSEMKAAFDPKHAEPSTQQMRELAMLRAWNEGKPL